MGRRLVRRAQTKEPPKFTAYVAGVDEAGCGPLAGPVTAASVVLPRGYKNSAIVDSKKLDEDARAELFLEIQRVSVAYCVASVGHRRIDQLNIRRATALAHKLVMERLYRKLFATLPACRSESLLYFLIDGNIPVETPCSYETIIKGDDKILSISAASILAKVTRDRIMATLDGRYPQYGFSQHKGYGTKEHRVSIATSGPCSVHRRTFAGVKEFCGGNGSSGAQQQALAFECEVECAA